MNTDSTISERKDCMSDMPAALMAVSSELSPRFPYVMSEDSSMARGKACGTSIRLMYQKNCANISIERPFPISSSIYRHRNCIISTNWQMKNVPTKSRPNCREINISNFLIRNIAVHYCFKHACVLICKISIKISESFLFCVFYHFLSCLYLLFIMIKLS